MKRVVVGITGASGSVYGKKMVEVLLENNIETDLILTDTAKQVIAYELNLSVQDWLAKLKKDYKHFSLNENDNLFAKVASGSYHFDAAIILPCSMGTLAEISHGLAKNLLCRVADVALKEKRSLVIVPRETPLNAIHLENMLKLSQLGASIVPAMPGFYHHPSTMTDLIDFVVGKILDHLSIENDLFKKWGN
ncbi:UbiX family flavin prenyltransferase [Amphibacillus cookii]|uniref:UbiX family flavin prenyltransferase n=1 Tax=Amphibacillus cookii TaxID=767787 RepID=UPI0019584F7B|nr:flavin prenyltransferase UbiX [Amphibacillus cookii]MBM7542071.1 4-hydroxy-3-polyprenylbenzoate decarboxylase [Amphibacillus cookii]